MQRFIDRTHYVVLRTAEEYHLFMHYCHECGLRWGSGLDPLDKPIEQVGINGCQDVIFCYRLSGKEGITSGTRIPYDKPRLRVKDLVLISIDCNPIDDLVSLLMEV